VCNQTNVTTNTRVPETYLCIFLQTNSEETTLEFDPQISLPTVSICGLLYGSTKRRTVNVLLFYWYCFTDKERWHYHRIADRRLPFLVLAWNVRRQKKKKSPFILQVLEECYLLTPLPPFLAQEHTCENRRQSGGTMQQFPRAIFRFNSTHERKNVTINRAELQENATERQWYCEADVFQSRRKEQKETNKRMSLPYVETYCQTTLKIYKSILD
jgi:hypothetical protein